MRVVGLSSFMQSRSTTNSDIPPSMINQNLYLWYIGETDHNERLVWWINPLQRRVANEATLPWNERILDCVETKDTTLLSIEQL